MIEKILFGDRTVLVSASKKALASAFDHWANDDDEETTCVTATQEELEEWDWKISKERKH